MNRQLQVHDDDAHAEELALAHVAPSDIDVQIATAHRYPRSITDFQRDALTLATLDEDVASSMFYALPRADKTIEGPSARLAEVVASTWGNLRVESDIEAIDEKMITAVATCIDLQKNIAVRIRVKRRITDRYGKRFNDDLIVMTGNAASSIALRNAVFKVVPFALVKPIYMAARSASLGEGKTMTQKRAAVAGHLKKLGVKEADLLAKIGAKGWDDVSEGDLVTLRGLATAIAEGDVSVETAFASEAEEVAQATKARLSTIKSKAKAAKAKAPKVPQPPGDLTEEELAEAERHAAKDGE